MQSFAERCFDRLGRIARSRERFANRKYTGLVIDDDDVGESPSDVDTRATAKMLARSQDFCGPALMRR